MRVMHVQLQLPQQHRPDRPVQRLHAHRLRGMRPSHRAASGPAACRCFALTPQPTSSTFDVLRDKVSGCNCAQVWAVEYGQLPEAAGIWTKIAGDDALLSETDRFEEQIGKWITEKEGKLPLDITQ